MTLNFRKYNKRTNGYRPGTLNVQVNGIPIEDLCQEWAARTQEVVKLQANNERMKAQLIEQGKLIAELKGKLKEKENNNDNQ